LDRDQTLKEVNALPPHDRVIALRNLELSQDVSKYIKTGRRKISIRKLLKNKERTTPLEWDSDEFFE